MTFCLVAMVTAGGSADGLTVTWLQRDLPRGTMSLCPQSHTHSHQHLRESQPQKVNQLGAPAHPRQLPDQEHQLRCLSQLGQLHSEFERALCDHRQPARASRPQAPVQS